MTENEEFESKESEQYEAQKLSEAIDQRRAMQDLLASRGWAILEEVLREKADALSEAALQPILDTKIQLAAEHEKGQACFAREVLTLPKTLYDMADDVIEAAKMRGSEDED